jgi:hypothetical protein
MKAGNVFMLLQSVGNSPYGYGVRANRNRDMAFFNKRPMTGLSLSSRKDLQLNLKVEGIFEILDNKTTGAFGPEDLRSILIESKGKQDSYGFVICKPPSAGAAAPGAAAAGNNDYTPDQTVLYRRSDDKFFSLRYADKDSTDLLVNEDLSKSDLERILNWELLGAMYSGSGHLQKEVITLQDVQDKTGHSNVYFQVCMSLCVHVFMCCLA